MEVKKSANTVRPFWQAPPTQPAAPLRLNAEEMKEAILRRAKIKAEQAAKRADTIEFSDGDMLMIQALDISTQEVVDEAFLNEGDIDTFIDDLENLVGFLKLYKHNCYFDLCFGEMVDIEPEIAEITEPEKGER